MTETTTKPTTAALAQLRHRLTALRENEQGITLVELLVYSILTVVILGALAAFIINSFTAEKAVSSYTDATNEAQLVSISVQTGVRNSSALRLEQSGDTTLLFARTAGLAEVLNWQCQAWHFDLESGQVRTKTSPGAIAAPNPVDLASWPLLARGISKDPALPLLAVSGGTVKLNFDAYVSDNRLVEIRTSASSRVDVEESAPCF